MRRFWLRRDGGGVLRLRQKQLDFLWHAVVEDLELLAPEIRHRLALLVLRDHAHLHELGSGAKGRRLRRLLRHGGPCRRKKQQCDPFAHWLRAGTRKEPAAPEARSRTTTRISPD